MRHLLILVGSLTLLLSGTGCATLVRGEQQKMKFDSEPEGAKVVLNNGKTQQDYVTPATVKLIRKDKYNVEVSKAGYHPVQFEMTAQWDGASIGNMALPGGSIGAATDRAKGTDLAFYKLEKIKLTPVTGGDASPIKMAQYRGKLLTEAEYQKALADEIKYKQDIQRGSN
jgi:hypothetical protein